MSDDIYKTPQAQLGSDAPQERRYAGFWIRFGASIVDSILIIIATWPILYAMYGKDYFITQDATSGPLDILVSYVLPAVVIILFWIYRQATPGKMLLGLKIIDINSGAPLSTWQAIGRYLGYYVAMLPLMLGILWIAWDKRKQGWHDKLARTAVIRNS